MQVVMGVWYFLGLVALFASNKNKQSFAVETLRCFTRQKSGGDIFDGIMMILVAWPIIIVLGPITLIRFKMD